MYVYTCFLCIVKLSTKMECGLHCFTDFSVTRIKGLVWKLQNLRMLFGSLVSNHSKEPVLWRRQTKKKALDNLW